MSTTPQADNGPVMPPALGPLAPSRLLRLPPLPDRRRMGVGLPRGLAARPRSGRLPGAARGGGRRRGGPYKVEKPRRAATARAALAAGAAPGREPGRAVAGRVRAAGAD